MPTISTLPDDIETLKRLLIDRDQMIAKLMVEIARLKRWRFGRSTEQTDAALLQLQLALSDLRVTAIEDVVAPAIIAEEESTVAPPQTRSTGLRPVRRSFPATRDDHARAGELRLPGLWRRHAQTR